MSTEAKFTAIQTPKGDRVHVYLNDTHVWTMEMPYDTYSSVAESMALDETAKRLGRLIESAASASTGQEETR